ncbi:MAG: NAD(+)/NADH kinase, partial [Thermoplasmata archaeon]|nr:NAD(+)/NADH kinase [Thermoplasmata archaeon]
IFGRGNQQISSEVIKRVGKNNIIIVATPLKLQGIEALHVDTGDKRIDEMLSGWIRVITGYGYTRLVKII